MSDIAHTLSREAEAAAALVASMKDVLAGDDDLTADSIEGETGLVEAIVSADERLAEIDTHHEAIKTQIGNLKKRADRFDAQSDRIRAAITMAMEMATMRKVELPIATVSVRAVAPKVVIASEADVPSAFWKQPDPVLDKKAIMEALKSKTPVPGAELSNGGSTIAVRFQ